MEKVVVVSFKCLWLLGFHFLRKENCTIGCKQDNTNHTCRLLGQLLVEYFLEYLKKSFQKILQNF